MPEITMNKATPVCKTQSLTAEEVERYKRQMIVRGMGLQAQLRLKNASVLVVGAGGLGCPAALYLASAGIGTLGICDADVVEASNLHRQIGHASSSVGASKTRSLAAQCRALNPYPCYVMHEEAIGPENAARLVGAYSVILDCTDNAASRYLVSDACVLLCRPLVSAAAARTDGQLVVLNCPPAKQGRVDGGAAPCYRCLFPRPVNAGESCGEVGVLGPLVGMIGTLQAAEAIKIVVEGMHVPRGEEEASKFRAGVKAGAKLLLFSFRLGTLGASSYSEPFGTRTMNMGGRRPKCATCGPGSTLTLESLRTGRGANYVFEACDPEGPLQPLPSANRVSPREYRAETSGAKNGKKHVLLDVREAEFASFGLMEGAVSVPWSRLRRMLTVKRLETTRQREMAMGEKDEVDLRGGADSGQTEVNGDVDGEHDWLRKLDAETSIFVVCRVGNDSQRAVMVLKDAGFDNTNERKIADIVGGVEAWKRDVDPEIAFM